jgi:hypothetical protein
MGPCMEVYERGPYPPCTIRLPGHGRSRQRLMVPDAPLPTDQTDGLMN